MELLSQLKLINLKHESVMQQNSRIKWLEQGDSNYKYFYSMIEWKGRKNEIKGVEI